MDRLLASTAVFLLLLAPSKSDHLRQPSYFPTSSVNFIGDYFTPSDFYPSFFLRPPRQRGQPAPIFKVSDQHMFSRNIEQSFVKNLPSSFKGGPHQANLVTQNSFATTGYLPRFPPRNPPRQGQSSIGRQKTSVKFAQEPFKNSVQAFAPYVGPPMIKEAGKEVPAPAGFMFSFKLMDDPPLTPNANNLRPAAHASYTVPRLNAGVLPLQGEAAKWRISYEFPPYRK